MSEVSSLAVVGVILSSFGGWAPLSLWPLASLIVAYASPQIQEGFWGSSLVAGCLIWGFSVGWVFSLLVVLGLLFFMGLLHSSCVRLLLSYFSDFITVCGTGAPL